MKIFRSVQESKWFLEVPTSVFEVTNVVAAAAKIGIMVEWIDMTLNEITAKRDHFALLQEA